MLPMIVYAVKLVIFADLLHRNINIKSQEIKMIVMYVYIILASTVGTSKGKIELYTCMYHNYGEKVCCM